MAPHWTEKDIPDQTGRVAVVTGANSGIGWETARALAQKGAKVIAACRSRQKADAAADQMMKLNPAGEAEGMTLDLADLDSVRAFAGGFLEKFDRLDLLINNAGIMFTPFGKTAQGFEQQFGVNHLGHFALTGLLLDALNGTPGARVVTVSSGMHLLGGVDFDRMNLERGYSPQRAYGRSKLANLLFTCELQRRLAAAGKGTLAVAAHPGYAATNLTRYSGRPVRLLDRFFGQKKEIGALPSLYAATSPDVSGGEYYGPGGLLELRGYPIKVASNALSHDEDAARRLWALSEDMTRVKFPL